MHLLYRWNVIQQRAVRLSLLHWQHTNMAKVFQRWREYKGRRAQLFGSLIALACKWEQPLIEDAWAAWREYTVESKRIKVCFTPASASQNISGACSSLSTTKSMTELPYSQE